MPIVRGKFVPPEGGEPRPAFGPEYEAWFTERIPRTPLSAHRNNYEVVSNEIKSAFERSSFWENVRSSLHELDAQYVLTNEFPLVTEFAPEILIKTWESFFEKSYRKNISQNKNFPEPPVDGWCLPPHWYSLISDIVRTSIVVRYIDGVPQVLEMLNARATGGGFLHSSELAAREDGYYGAHFDFQMACDVQTMSWQKENRLIHIEIQITTQIKEVIKHLLHSYYEDRRLYNKSVNLADVAWNYKGDEFAATYLGHLLHYVEGMIIDARERKRARDA